MIKTKLTLSVFLVGLLASLAHGDATTLWTNTTNNIGSWNDVLALNNGKFVATGSIEDPSQGRNGVVRCWDKDGVTQWTYEFPDQGAPDSESGEKLALAPDGTIIFSGIRQGSPSDELLFARLDQSGIELARHVENIGGTYSLYSTTDLVIDASGQIYASFIGSFDNVLLSIDSGLNLLWITDTVRINDLEVLANGRIAACGQRYVIGSGNTSFLMLIDPSGTVFSSSLFHSDLYAEAKQVVGDSQSRCFVRDNDDHIYLIGSNGAQLGDLNAGLADTYECCVAYHEPTDSLFVMDEDYSTDGIIVRKFNSAGVLQWTATRNADLAAQTRMIQADKYGNVVVVALNGQHDPDTNIGAWCFSNDGKFQWHNGTSDTPDWNNEPVDFAIDDKLRLVVVGTLENVANGNNFGYVWRTSQFFHSSPDLATVRLGRRVAGNMDSLVNDDGDYYTVCRFIVPNQQVRPIVVEFDVVFPIGNANPGQTDLRVHTRQFANSPGLAQWIQLYNWDTAAWTTPTNYNLSLTEQSFDVSFANVAPYFEGTGQHVRGRISVGAVGPVTVQAICTSIDEFQFRSDTD